MRHSISLLALILTGALVTISAQSEAGELKTTKHVIGPITIGYQQSLKICMTDVAGLTGAASKTASHDESSQIHTQVLIFDSNNPTEPLASVDGDVDGRDFLVWNRGYGTCANVGGGFIGGVYVAAGDINNDGKEEPRSIIAVLISITEGTEVFQPMVTGQLIAPDGTSTVGLLLPAVQAAEEAPKRPPPPPQN